MHRRVVPAMIKRRVAAARLPPSTCCHTFRATGITAYLLNGAPSSPRSRHAGHALPKTTNLYDGTADRVTVDKIERIVDLRGSRRGDLSRFSGDHAARLDRA